MKRTGSKSGLKRSRILDFPLLCRPVTELPESGAWLTMSEAAAELGVTNHVIRRLIKIGALPAEQVVPRAPYQIRAEDLHSEAVKAALVSRNGPCRIDSELQMSLFTRS